MSEPYRFLIRNRGYTRSQINGIHAHNERTKNRYRNCDVIAERKDDNIHFKSPEGTYTEMLDKMLSNSIVSTRGLKSDAILFDEFIIDVNSRYFEEGGGLPFAKKFYESAYRFACDEVGEGNILSAVMHADERNVALSEEHGYSVFHYHLHVIFLPTVKKEIKYSKRCKDPNLIGKTKAVITQISHSKRWASEPLTDENGKTIRDESGNAVLDYSYSGLQTRFADYMRAEGFDDVERGLQNSRAKHKDIVTFKLEQDIKRAEAATMRANSMEAHANELERQTSEIKHDINLATTQANKLKSDIVQMERYSNTLASEIEDAESELTEIKDFSEYQNTVSDCRNLLQHIFDALTEFFNRSGMFRDKKAEQSLLAKIQSGFENFFQKLRSLVGFEYLTKMSAHECESVHLIDEASKLSLTQQIDSATKKQSPSNHNTYEFER